MQRQVPKQSFAAVAALGEEMIVIWEAQKVWRELVSVDDERAAARCGLRRGEEQRGACRLRTVMRGPSDGEIGRDGEFLHLT